MFKFKKKKLIYFLAPCLLLLFISYSSGFTRAPFLSTLRHPLSLLALIKRECSGIVFYHRNLYQNQNLKQQIDLLRSKLNSLNEVSLENARLNNLLSLKKQSPYKLIAARVIARSADSWSSAAIIDKGSSSGIKQGLAVITYLGFVGRVIEVSGPTSKILLISDQNLSISAQVQRSRQEGSVSGTLGNHLIMKYLPREADVKISDTVISSGLNGTYPKGLLIGTVVDIGTEFSGLSHYAIIKPAVNLSDIEEVLIIFQ